MYVQYSGFVEDDSSSAHLSSVRSVDQRHVASEPPDRCLHACRVSPSSAWHEAGAEAA